MQGDRQSLKRAKLQILKTENTKEKPYLDILRASNATY